MTEIKIKLTLNKILFTVFLLFFSWIVTSVLAWLFIAEFTNKSFFLFEGIYDKLLNPYIVVLGVFFLLALLLCSKKWARVISLATHHRLFFVIMSILLLIQLIFSYTIRVDPQVWDFATIYQAAIGIAKGYKTLGHYFFDDYPNNIGITLLLAGIFKAAARFGAKNFNNVGIFFNIFMLDTGIILLYLTSKKLFGVRNSTILLFICLLFSPFITYVPIFYSDTISLPFGIGILYCYILSTEAKSKCKKYFNLIVLSLLALIGYILKPTIIIIVLALIIHLFLTTKFVLAFRNTAIILIFLIVGVSIYGLLIDHSKLLPISFKQAGYPASHWVMMGLKEPFGFYDADDVIYTESFDSKVVRAEANKAIIKMRIQNYGLSGILKLFNTKNIFVWGDGTYFAPVKLSREVLHYTKYYKYILPLKENENYIYVYLSCIVQISLLILMLISGFYNIKNSKIGILTICNLTALGAGLFFLVWEARSRYLINISPLLILCSMDGLLRLSASSLHKKVSIPYEIVYLPQKAASLAHNIASSLHKRVTYLHKRTP